MGRLVAPREVVPLEDLVRDALSRQSERQRQRDIRVEISSLPQVYGDGPRLKEVIENLLDNAIKFMGNESHKRLEIGAIRDQEEAVIYFRDNGTGMSEQDAKLSVLKHTTSKISRIDDLSTVSSM